MRDREHNVVVKVNGDELAKIHALADDRDESIAQMIRGWAKTAYTARFGVEGPAGFSVFIRRIDDGTLHAMRRAKTCPECGAIITGTPMAKHDAYWCKACDRWLEDACSDAACRFCATRPERPSMVDDKRSW